MRSLQSVAACLILCALIVRPATAQNAKVELEIFADSSAPLTAQQEWLSNLAQAGVQNLRFRPQQPDDKLAIETRGTLSSPTYVVTGALSANGELQVPGARFRPGEAVRLARWLSDVARMGPSHTERKTAYGLTASQFALIHKDLTQPVGLPTKNRSKREVIENIARRLTSPLQMDAGQLEALEGEPVKVELSGLSCGTVLAYMLRAPGLAMMPAAAGGGRVEYRVVGSKPGLEIWPVGWDSDRPLQQLLPTMFEFFNANVQGVPVSQVLEVVGERLKVPVVLDENALARYDIQPEKVICNVPPARTSYNLLLRKVLSPAHLKFEVRADEAGKPFVWVTSVRAL